MGFSIFDIDALLKTYGGSPEYIVQFEHRVNIVKSWNIPPGSRVLEIGPGQGDCTIVLATAVGESGHVDAVDPAPLNYGTPIFLSSSHSCFFSWISSTTSHPPAQAPPSQSANLKPSSPPPISVPVSAGSKTLHSTTSLPSPPPNNLTHTSSSSTPSGTSPRPQHSPPSYASFPPTRPQTRASASPNTLSAPLL